MIRWIRKLRRRKPTTKYALPENQRLAELEWNESELLADALRRPAPPRWIGPGDWSKEALQAENHHRRMPQEVSSSMYRRCDLCDFFVRDDDPNVLDWALRDHMDRNHPTKGRRPLQ